MRISTPVDPGWIERIALLAAHGVSWWAALTVAGTVVAGLVFRLLAERGRRKTLEAAFQAPANTVVVLDKGPGGPSMWIWVGDTPSPGRADPVIWVCHRSAEQVRSRRQG